MTIRNTSAVLWLALCVPCLAGCASLERRASSAPASLAPDRRILLNAHELRLHFANPSADPSRPLLIYATGDGGWHRKDLAVYRHLVSSGDPIVGFDAHDYVTHLGPNEATTPGRLAKDYGRIIQAARAALNSPNRPIVLVGVSRGAGLSVVAAGQRALRPSISGVVAVALTREEEYVKWFRRLRRRAPRQRTPVPVMVAVYDYLPRLAGMPIAVIQSTRDNYLPAADARMLFGPDTPHRWLQPIVARNHSFGGARPQLYQAVQRSLDWIQGLIPSAR